MGGYPHELLNLSTPNGIVRENSNYNKRSHESASDQDKRLELKLGTPVENQPLHHISPKSHNKNNRYITALGAKREFLDTIIEAETKERNWLTNREELQSGPEKKAYATPAISPLNIGVPNSSKKRIDLRPVVGWPPVRSCRKNILTSNSTKLEPESSNKAGKEVAGGKSEILEKSLFVKIKMDGVPIGRKVDLKSCSSYDKLASAVDELFRGLLAAQGDYSHSLDEKKAITGLLDGSGDYNLVYEDNEGDRMLVGDVPWHMFISSARRLRVLKKNELSGLHTEFYRLHICFLLIQTDSYVGKLRRLTIQFYMFAVIS